MKNSARQQGDGPGGNGLPIISEHDLVRLTRGVRTEGYRIPKNTAGTVVAIYGKGAAYAVETAILPGGPEVVTLRADQVERVR